MPTVNGAQEEIFNDLVKDVFNDFDESRLNISVVKEALSENAEALQNFPFQLLCQLAPYFDACCPVVWNAFIDSFSNSQVKEKLLEEQRLRALAQDTFYNAIVCGLGADNLAEIEHFVYVGLYLKAIDVYTGFYANEMKARGLGADFLRPLFSLALQTRYQDEDNKKITDAANIIVEYSAEDGWGDGELLCSLAGVDSNILYFSKQKYPKLAVRAVKKVVIEEEAATALEEKFEGWRVNAKKDPNKKIVDYLVDLPDPRNSIVLELIKCNPDQSMYSITHIK